MFKFIKDLFFYLKETKNDKILYAFLILFLLFLSALYFMPSIFAYFYIPIALIVLFLFLKFNKSSSLESFYNKIKYTELKAVIENIEDGIIVYDTDFKIVDFNAGAEKIFGIKKEEVVGKKIIPEEKDPRFKTLTQTIFTSLAPSIATISNFGWPKIIEIYFEDPHLELKTILNQVVDEKNKTIAFVKIVIDKTRESDILKSKSEFLTVSAHQLRTPLTALSWTLESLNNEIESEKNKIKKETGDLVKEAWSLTKRSLKIIDDLLNAARIEEGRFGFNFKALDLSELLKTIVKEVYAIAETFKIKIGLEIKKSPVIIMADEEKLTMAITNIIENAIKYNYENGLVNITLEIDPYLKNSARLSIADTGIGIPKESLPKIFSKFYRAENAQKLEPNGSGLGLYITKNIIEKHGGKIHIESQEKRGTTFIINIPINISPETK